MDASRNVHLPLPHRSWCVPALLRLRVPTADGQLGLRNPPGNGLFGLRDVLVSEGAYVPKRRKTTPKGVIGVRVYARAPERRFWWR